MAGVSVKIGATADELEAAIKRAKSQMADLRAEMRQGLADAKRLGSGMAVAATEGIRDMVSLGQSAVDSVAKLLQSLDGRTVGAYALEALSQPAAGEVAKLEGGHDQGGNSDQDSDAQKRNREMLEANIEAIRQANETEMELLLEKQQAELDAIEEGRQAKLNLALDWNDLEQGTKERHEEEVTALEKKSAAERKKIHEDELKSKQATLGQILGNMSSLMSSESRKMFEIGKVAAIANAIVATYQGMSEALKLGWPRGPIAAAAIGAAGFQNVAAIRSQAFGGGGGGSGGGGGAAAGEAISDSINDNTQPTPPPMQRNVSISVIGDTLSRDAVRGLIDAIGGEMDDNVSLRMS